MRRFVLGDIHGAHKALIQCFERSGFDREKDLLISLGDLADGWPDVGNVFNELIKVKNLVSILGNHDEWLLQWFNTGESPEIWLSQGGLQTLESLGRNTPPQYKELLEKSILYYKTGNSLFVHAGILVHKTLDQHNREEFLWDRSFIRALLADIKNGTNRRLTGYDMVFVGHTPTINFGPPVPIISNGVCMMDTGAGWPGGVLSIMDIDSFNVYSSDRVDHLYPGFTPR